MEVLAIEKECVICGESFETYPSEDCDTCSKECGYKLLSQKQRNEEKECAAPDCSEMFHTSQPDVRFCSLDCAYGNRSRDGKTRFESDCEFCGEKYEVPPFRADSTRFCSVECKDKNRRENFTGKNNPAWNSVEIECDSCGTAFYVKKSHARTRRFCSNECYHDWKSVAMRGESNPSWNPHYDADYGSDWKEVRQKIWERDSCSCVVCGRGEEEIGRRPDVHHVKPLSEFDSPESANRLDNLITLCPRHHKLVEGWGLLPSNIRVGAIGQ